MLGLLGPLLDLLLGLPGLLGLGLGLGRAGAGGAGAALLDCSFNLLKLGLSAGTLDELT